MSISIAHPERYDAFAWGTLNGIPDAEGADPHWDCLGYDGGGDSVTMEFLWGHLKPEYQNGNAYVTAHFLHNFLAEFQQTVNEISASIYSLRKQ